MSPCWVLRCKKCNYETEILLYNEKAIGSFVCSECRSKGLWEKMPTVPLLPPDGTYSWREKK